MSGLDEALNDARNDDGRPLLLGEAPSRSGDRYWQFPLSGMVGKRLCLLAGLTPDEEGSTYGRYYWPLVEAFWPRNLFKRYPGAQGSGAALPADRARELAREIYLPRVVVLLGVRLQRAFGLGDAPFYQWVDYQRSEDGVIVAYGDDAQDAGRTVRHPSGLGLFETQRLLAVPAGGLRHVVVAIPHPSGLNRLYNAGEHRDSASRVLREAIERSVSARG